MQDLNSAIEYWISLHKKYNGNSAKKHLSQEVVTTYKQAVNQLFDNLTDYIYFIFINRNVSSYVAQDLTSKTLFKIYKAMHKLNVDGVSSFRAWVHKICINVYYDYLRQQKRKKIFSFAMIFGNKDRQKNNNLETETVIDTNLEDEYIQVDNQIEMQHLLDALPAKDKDILLLRYVYGLSYKEIAKELNISEQTARKRVSRIIKKIKDSNVTKN